MRSLPGLVLLLVATAAAGSAQVAQSNVCDVLANPASFDGKTVKLRGTVTLQPEEFSLQANCPARTDTAGVWLEYGYPQPSPTPFCCPGGWDENGRPIFSTPRIMLIRDKNFDQLKSYLSKRREGRDSYGEKCDRFRPAPLECQKYEVTATLVGRVAGVRMSSNEAGFGHFGMYAAKLVIQRVEQVSAKEVKRTAPPSRTRRVRRPRRRPLPR